MHVIITKSKGRHTKRCLALFLLALCLAACPVEPEDEGGSIIAVNLPIDGSGTRHYYDLSTGEETSPAGDNWDLALEALDGAFSMLTNSGDTAAALDMEAGGKGGVWFTGNTDFEAVTAAAQRVLPAADSEYEPYTADTYRYTMLMAANPVKQTLNVMTYAGYRAGDGLTTETRFEYNTPDMGNMGSFSPYLFNKKQAYRMVGMPPGYTPTKQVYIVRHGDGTGYSKVQLSEVYLERGTDPSHFGLQVRHGIVE
jgi:hypothetical protein